MPRAIETLWPKVTHAISSVLHEIMPVSREEMEKQYLNEAKDLYDLEYRMRELDRGTAIRPRFAGNTAIN